MMKDQISVYFVHKNESGDDIGRDRFDIHPDDLEVEFVEWVRNYVPLAVGDSVSVEYV